ncbi:MAG: aromatic ring-hydroxylating dioxygenase subunit alpha, partial [Polyangiaceae bacterium]|nr:aromatic ring-hydroxylating dioxygenase subunit alpha [Polyangiaceae bacterium]
MSDFIPPSDLTAKQPPSFEEATSLRHKAWAAGFDPSYWYAVEYESNVRAGEVVEVKFQGTSVALFRGEDGTLGAIENRCVHRQVKLSSGKVKQCQLTCRYHGWAYGADGKLTDIPHEYPGKGLPQVRLRSYPVSVKYGLVWIFFGDTALMDERPIPTVEVLEGKNTWLHVPIDFTMKCHPTAYINNVMDSTHVAALHRQFRTRSMIYGKITRCEAEGDSVVISHDIQLDPGGLLRHMVKPLRTHSQDAFYDYSYLRVQVGGVFQLWNFMLPIDANTTRIFLLSCTERVNIPFTPWPPPDALLRPFMGFARELLVRPLFDEDVWSTEAEQEGYEAHFDAPAIDPHPSIRPCYQLTVRKWEEHLAREASKLRPADKPAETAAEDSKP